MFDWLHRLNRRRLRRRRAAQARAAWQAWLKLDDPADAQVASALRERAQRLTQRPLISVCFWPDAPLDDDAVAALREQMYPRWELLVPSDAPPPVDERIRVVRETAPTAIGRFNATVAQALGEWVVPLQAADRLACHALLLLAEAAERFDRADLIHADSDHIARSGVRHSPWLLCDANLELLRSADYLSGFTAIRRSAWTALGGLRSDLDGAAWHDLKLKLFERAPSRPVVHVPHVLLHHRAEAPQPAQAPPPASALQVQAVAQHLQRCAVAASVEPARDGGAWVRYVCPAPAPKVSLIVPTRNGLHLLRRCIDSVLTRTDYPDFEILIVDNGSDDPATLEYLRTIESEPRVRVRRDDRPFNFAALNNDAVPHCHGELLAFVNNDIEATDGCWLAEMVGHALRPDVGAVGARLWYGDGTLQHGGVLLGLGGWAGHMHSHLRPDEPGHAGRARLTQELSAVTAACMLVRRTVYQQVGGMDADHLVVDFNDIDFCLKLRAAGYRVIWTPHAQLIHHESATRGANRSTEQLARYARESACMRQRWARWLDNDPAYNPNWSLRNRDFEFTVAAEPRVSLLRPWFDSGG
ncbi:MAG TPA: glycosyltransferase family 2 protein [Burkholderiaceae bacterium]